MAKRKIGFVCNQIWEVDDTDLKKKKLSMDDVLIKIQKGVGENFIVGEIL